MSQTPTMAASDFEWDAGTVAREIGDIVLHKIANDKLVIPPMPEVAVQCLALLRDANVMLRKLVTPLERDPPLTAQVVRLANSAAYAGTAPVYTIEQAVTRLGHLRVKSLLIEASAARLFRSADPRIAEACEGVWDHSVAVALLSRDLCALTSGVDGEAAYLAGLLHDVGKPIVAAILLEAEKQLSTRSRSGWLSAAVWLRVIANAHRPVGVALAEKWALPEPVRVAIRDAGEFDVVARKSAANYVRFANALVKTLGLAVGPVDLDDAQALVMVGRSLLDLNDEVIQRLTRDLATRVRSQGR